MNQQELTNDDFKLKKKPFGLQGFHKTNQRFRVTVCLRARWFVIEHSSIDSTAYIVNKCHLMI